MALKAKNFKKYNRLLGLDISENNISLVEVVFIKNKVIITNGFHLNISTFKDINNTVSLIKQNLKALNIKTKECSIGYSMQYFKIHPIPIPKTIPEEEIGSIIFQEGNIDPSDSSVCWLPLNSTKRDEPDGITRYDVLGIGVNNSLIDAAKLICQKCGLKLVSIIPSFLGLSTILTENAINSLVATLWVSQIRTELIIWFGNEPLYEHLFLTHQMNEQIFQSINIIQSQLGGAQVSTIYVCGPYSRVINFKQLPYNFQPLTLTPNVFDIAKTANNVDLTNSFLSLGIALYSSNNILLSHFPINFLNPVSIKKSKVDNLKGAFKTFASAQTKNTKKAKPAISFSFFKSLDPKLAKALTISIFLLLTIVFSGVYIQNYLVPDVEIEQNTLANRISFAQSHFNRLLTFEKTNKVLTLKFNYLAELIDKRKSWSKILREVGNMTPKDLWIDRLDVRSDNLDIFGRALSVDAVANYSINLNYTAKLVGDAKIIALRKFEEDGLDIVEFQISTHLKNIINDLKNEQKSGVKNLKLSLDKGSKT